jgi:hypothetical protein
MSDCVGNRGLLIGTLHDRKTNTDPESTEDEDARLSGEERGHHYASAIL